MIEVFTVQDDAWAVNTIKTPKSDLSPMFSPSLKSKTYLNLVKLPMDVFRL